MKSTSIGKYLDLVEPYEDKWVALNEEKNKVVSAAPTLKELEESLTHVKIPLVIHRVLPKNRGFATGVYL